MDRSPSQLSITGQLSYVGDNTVVNGNVCQCYTGQSDHSCVVSGTAGNCTSSCIGGHVGAAVVFCFQNDLQVCAALNQEEFQSVVVAGAQSTAVVGVSVATQNNGVTSCERTDGEVSCCISGYRLVSV